MIRVLMCAALTVSLTACKDDDGTGPDNDSPNLAGTWTGAWVTGTNTATVQMQLTQSGTTVSGTMTVGRETVTISGTINDVGELRFETTVVSVPQCSRYSTLANNDVQLLQGGGHLEGPVIRRSCNDANGFTRTLSVDKL
jgi:hypothetical protein